MVSDQQFAALAAQVAQLQAMLASGGGNAFNPSGDPYIVPGPRDFYAYTQKATALAAAATTSLVYQIEADSYFYLNALSFQADIAAAVVTDSTNVIPLVTVVMVDSGSGRALMANPTPLNCLCGYNGGPFRFPKPRRFAATSQITATLVNYSAATSYNIYLTLSGFKVYVQQALTTAGQIGA